jgi:hypothetical protein
MIMRKFAVLGIIALAACGKPNDQALICPSGKPIELETNDALGVKSKGDACAANWGSRLAKSQEPFDVVLRAVKSRCEPWARDYGVLVAKEAKGAPAMAVEHSQFQREAQQRIAEFSILRTRAGNCDPT